jgi:predicted RNase H-like HicB family nuclease
MRFFSFEVVIEKETEDEGYYAWSPTLPGCFSNGRSIEEAKRNMRVGVTQHVTVLLDHGDPVPQNERLVYVKEMAISTMTKDADADLPS